MDAHRGVYDLFCFAAAAALLILRLRNADVRIPHPAPAVVATVMLLRFLNVGRNKTSYFDAYTLFLAGVALLFVRVWDAADRPRPARDVAALAIVIALLIAKLAVVAVLSWFPSEGAEADGRINSDDVSMISVAGIVLNMLAEFM